MRPHPRIQQRVKWYSLLFALLLVGTIARTAQYGVIREWNDAKSMYMFGLSDGALVWASAPLPPAMPSGIYLAGTVTVEHSDWRVRWWFGSFRMGQFSGSAAPLWIPALVLFVASAWTWWLDIIARRRAKMHVCKACGYDLAGLSAAAPCPECGKGAASERGMGVPGETV